MGLRYNIPEEPIPGGTVEGNPICPICGESPDYAYYDRDGKLVGCEACVSKRSWEDSPELLGATDFTYHVPKVTIPLYEYDALQVARNDRDYLYEAVFKLIETDSNDEANRVLIKLLRKRDEKRFENMLFNLKGEN